MVINTFRPRQNGRHFADDIFNSIFLNENVWIPIKISLKFVLKDPINNIPALVQIMAWRRPGDKPLSEPMIVNLLTHINIINHGLACGYNLKRTVGCLSGVGLKKLAVSWLFSIESSTLIGHVASMLFKQIIFVCVCVIRSVNVFPVYLSNRRFSFLSLIS